MAKKLVCCFIIMLMFIVPIWSKHIIAEATLHITLYVPPKQVEEETEPGDYGDYTVDKSDDVIYVEEK